MLGRAIPSGIVVETVGVRGWVDGALLAETLHVLVSQLLITSQILGVYPKHCSKHFESPLAGFFQVHLDAR